MRILGFSMFAIVVTCAIPAAAQNRACGLLTLAEVRQATGIAFEEPTATATPRGDVVCAFRGPQHSQFNIAIHEKGAKALFESAKERTKGSGPASIRGIGDDNYSNEMGRIQVLTILKGDSTVTLNLLGNPGTMPKLQELARKAMSRF